MTSVSLRWFRCALLQAELKKMYFELFAVDGDLHYWSLLLLWSAAAPAGPGPYRAVGMHRAFLVNGLRMQGQFIKWDEQCVSREHIERIMEVYRRRELEYEPSLNRLFDAGDDEEGGGGGDGGGDGGDSVRTVTFHECCEKFEGLELAWLEAPSYKLVDVAAVLAAHGVF